MIPPDTSRTKSEKLSVLCVSVSNCYRIWLARKLVLGTWCFTIIRKLGWVE